MELVDNHVNQAIDAKENKSQRPRGRHITKSKKQKQENILEKAEDSIDATQNPSDPQKIDELANHKKKQTKKFKEDKTTSSEKENKIISSSKNSESEPANKTNEVEQKPFIIDIDSLFSKSAKTLKSLCLELGISLNKQNHQLKHFIVFTVIKKYQEIHVKALQIICRGVVELSNNTGFIRSPYNDYKQSSTDVYINNSLIKQFSLKTGDTIVGIAKPPKIKEKYISLSSIQEINLYNINDKPDPVLLENEITEYPNQRIFFEKNQNDLSGRMLDLITPMGLGQRAIISAAPRTGKTDLMKSMALSIRQNHPNVKLIVLLIDERPEEVTDMKNSIEGAEVIASTFDEDPVTQIHLAEITYNKARRLAEYGHDVFIIMDSIGRLTRNFNQVQSNSGRSLSGGIDANALYRTKKFIGLARKLKEGGSISIVGSCLINTNSKLDEVVHEEFKGRGNCDIYLSSQLSNRRIYPAFDIEKSGTRREELLLHKDELVKHNKLRRELAGYGSVEQSSLLINRLKDTNTNIELLMSI